MTSLTSSDLSSSSVTSNSVRLASFALSFDRSFCAPAFRFKVLAGDRYFRDDGCCHLSRLAGLTSDLRW